MWCQQEDTFVQQDQKSGGVDVIKSRQSSVVVHKKEKHIPAPSSLRTVSSETATKPASDEAAINSWVNELVMLGLEIALANNEEYYNTTMQPPPAPAPPRVAITKQQPEQQQVPITPHSVKKRAPNNDKVGTKCAEDEPALDQTKPKQYFLKTDKDVITGRGKSTLYHNAFFRREALLHLPKYCSSGRGAIEKRTIANSLYEWVHANGGRFLDMEDGRWYEVTELAALKKIHHTMRDMIRDVNVRHSERRRKANNMKKTELDSISIITVPFEEAAAPTRNQFIKRQERAQVMRRIDDAWFR